MSEQAVRARAREAGLAVDWVDAMGRPQQVKTEALRRILESLDATRDNDVRPLVTAQADARIELPGLSTEADRPAELVLEDGSVRSVTIRGGKAATLPAYFQFQGKRGQRVHQCVRRENGGKGGGAGVGAFDHVVAGHDVG